jgi:hypothetical protein
MPEQRKRWFHKSTKRALSIDLSITSVTPPRWRSTTGSGRRDRGFIRKRGNSFQVLVFSGFHSEGARTCGLSRSGSVRRSEIVRGRRCSVAAIVPQLVTPPLPSIDVMAQTATFEARLALTVTPEPLRVDTATARIIALRPLPT